MELDAYFPRIRPHVRGAPDQVLRDTLLIVLRDICYRANLWNYKDKLYLIPGLGEYEISSPAGTDVATIQRIIRPDGTDLESRDILPPSLTRGAPRFFRHYERGEITVAPIPNQGVLHDIELTLMPALDATEIPEHLYGDTAEFAPWGVLAQLQMTEQEGWNNPQKAEYNRQRYERSLFRKRIRGMVGVSGAGQTVTRRRFV